MADIQEYWILPEGAVKRKGNALGVMHTNDHWAKQHAREYAEQHEDEKVQLWRISRNRNGVILRARQLEF